jgi:hypothetical protein
MSGEDSNYAIGAVELPDNISGPDLVKFEKEAIAIVDKVREEVEDYEDEDIIHAFEEAGYKIAESPWEVVVRF